MTDSEAEKVKIQRLLKLKKEPRYLKFQVSNYKFLHRDTLKNPDKQKFVGSSQYIQRASIGTSHYQN